MVIAGCLLARGEEGRGMSDGPFSSPFLTFQNSNQPPEPSPGPQKIPPTPRHLAYRSGRVCVQVVSVWCFVCLTQVMNTNLEVSGVLLVSKVGAVLSPHGDMDGNCHLGDTSQYSRLEFLT